MNRDRSKIEMPAGFLRNSGGVALASDMLVASREQVFHRRGGRISGAHFLESRREVACRGTAWCLREEAERE